MLQVGDPPLMMPVPSRMLKGLFTVLVDSHRGLSEGPPDPAQLDAQGMARCRRARRCPPVGGRRDPTQLGEHPGEMMAIAEPMCVGDVVNAVVTAFQGDAGMADALALMPILGCQPGLLAEPPDEGAQMHVSGPRELAVGDPPMQMPLAKGDRGSQGSGKTRRVLEAVGDPGHHPQEQGGGKGPATLTAGGRAQFAAGLGQSGGAGHLMDAWPNPGKQAIPDGMEEEMIAGAVADAAVLGLRGDEQQPLGSQGDLHPIAADRPSRGGVPVQPPVRPGQPVVPPGVEAASEEVEDVDPHAILIHI